MLNNKSTGVAVIVADIFPFVADHMGWWAAVLGTGNLSTTVLAVYTVTLIAVVVAMLVTATQLDRREKWIWGGAMVLAFPLATLALMYRLFWYQPKPT